MVSDKLFETAEIAVKQLNAAIAEDSHKGIKTARETVSEAIAKYNEAVRNNEYEKLLKTENPFYEAVKMCYIPYIKLTNKIDKETKIETASLEESEEVINLIELENNCKDRMLACNGQWQFWIEKFNYVMAARANADIGGDKDKFHKAYKISVTAKGCDIGATPTSNTQMLKQLQTIIDGILFEADDKGLNKYKALTSDVKYILYLMCKKGKNQLSVSLPRNSTMIRLVTEVLHRIVTNASYTSEYEMIKK